MTSQLNQGCLNVNPGKFIRDTGQGILTGPIKKKCEKKSHLFLIIAFSFNNKAYTSFCKNNFKAHDLACTDINAPQSDIVDPTNILHSTTFIPQYRKVESQSSLRQKVHMIIVVQKLIIVIVRTLAIRTCIVVETGIRIRVTLSSESSLRLCLTASTGTGTGTSTG